MNKIKFQIDGTIVAPSDYRSFSNSGVWILFRHLSGLLILGGTLDGKGQSYWNCKINVKSCPIGARGIHFAVDHCRQVLFEHVNINAPSTSPNTDGINVLLSSGITVSHATTGTGDDCISLSYGNTHVWIEHVNCDPGHGISIGSLGKFEHEAGVHNVTVMSSTFDRTQNGVRIKSWARPSHGYAKDISSGVKMIKVLYENIKGTSASREAINFDCSKSNPCQGIKLHDINLVYNKETATSTCTNALGISSGVVIPKGSESNTTTQIIDMLNMGRPKLILKPITNGRERDLAFMKRKKGLIKTISEFSRVCGVRTCLIMYDGNGDSPPLTWPQDPNEMHSIIQRYESIMYDRIPKNFDLSTFFEIRKNMVDTEISKVQKDTLKIKYPTWHPCFDNLGAEELRNFIAILDIKLEACNQRTKMFKCKKQNEAEFNFMQCLVQPECVLPNPSQPGFMENISQNQSSLSPVMPLTDGNLVASYLHKFEKGSSSQSQMLNFDSNLMHLEAEHKGVVDTTNHVVGSQDYGSQVDAFGNSSNKLVPSDLLHESLNICNLLGEIQSMNQHWRSNQHQAQMIGGSNTAMNDVTTYDATLLGNQYNPESSLCNYNGVVQSYNYDAPLQSIGFQVENLQQMIVSKSLVIVLSDKEEKLLTYGNNMIMLVFQRVQTLVGEGNNIPTDEKKRIGHQHALFYPQETVTLIWLHKTSKLNKIYRKIQNYRQESSTSASQSIRDLLSICKPLKQAHCHTGEIAYSCKFHQGSNYLNSFSLPVCSNDIRLWNRNHLVS
ncbi:unnamed protein product [Sphenostylis stenocarpa]|uniref:MADS-box domain-containing protein n=1 Tax=Sphenostylis stenocarpa TaxID=92480 RepID=A0AA86SZ80_9FABA|nr:unnamed protein product [Sphenostylis stenocarpa]